MRCKVSNLVKTKELIQTLSIHELSGLTNFITEVMTVKKDEELEKALQPLNELADTLGIPISELLNKKSTTKRKSKEELVPTHRDPNNPSNTWSGRGQRPKWLREELAKEGVSLDDFLIEKKSD